MDVLATGEPDEAVVVGWELELDETVALPLWALDTEIDVSGGMEADELSVG